MRAGAANSQDLLSSGFRLDASYHSSDGIKALHHLQQLELIKGLSNPVKRLDSLGNICDMFVGDWLKRIYVDDPKHGAPYITGDNILKLNPFGGGKYLSYRHGEYINQLSLQEKMIVMSCSGTVGRLAFVNSIMKGAVGSPDLLRILAKPNLILPGYLFAFLSSEMGHALIKKGVYGAVIQHIEIPYMDTIPIPRLDLVQERRIHELVEQAAELRVQANQRLRQTQERFYHQVLGIDPQHLVWQCRNEHAYAVGTFRFINPLHRLDGFHHVGYVGEAERYLGKTIQLGELVEPYQPPMFKRPYTGKNGIPFLSGIDLYDYYPKPHMYISRKMASLDLYIVQASTILVQNVGQRYGLFGRPTILPKHLDRCSVTQHLMRIYTKDARNRGFVYVWLSTEVGRRLLLKQSFGTSMGVLFERSFEEMPVPDCSTELSHSFEDDLQIICEMREQANELEDQAQSLLAQSLSLERVS